MDSDVIGSYPMVSGPYDVSGDVGRRHHRHHGHHGGGVPASALTPAQLDAIARPQGYQVIPTNPNQAGAAGVAGGFGQTLLPTGQRILPAAFPMQAGITAGSQFSASAQIQRGFQGRRLLVEAFVASSGASAKGFLHVTDVKVGQRTQIVSEGTLSPSIFDPTSFDCYLILDAARTGTVITVNGIIDAAAPGPVNVLVTLLGFSAD